ncbi:hypothetical protein D3C73_846830 [compost metagenome]
MIQIGIFRIPLPGLADRNFKPAGGTRPNAQFVRPLFTDAGFTVKELRLQTITASHALPQMLQLDVYRQQCIAILIVKGGNHSEIMNMRALLTDQINIAENTGHPPHVLIFDIGRIGPLQHANGQQVVPRLQIVAEIKLG